MKRITRLLVLGSVYLGELLTVGCTTDKGKQNAESKQVVASRQVVRERVSGKRTSPELNFLRAKRYKYVTRLAAIPSAALAAIENKSRLCDEASARPINLTDVHIGPENGKECTMKLNFALVGDTCCLVVYRQGGIGVHDVVYYTHYRGNYSFTTDHADNIEDTLQLARFLRERLVTVETFTSKLTPPPPWPRDTSN